MKTLRQELHELRTIRDIKNGALFQEYFVSPMLKEVEKLGKAYDCETLEELATIKGKCDAYKHFIGLLKKIDEDIVIKEAQAENE